MNRPYKKILQKNKHIYYLELSYIFKILIKITVCCDANFEIRYLKK